MKIKCINCGHVEKTDKDFFVKLIGGAMPVGGFWAWTTYLFAGTGFAMAIVVAIIGGGVAMLIFKDEIVEWIINNDYKCPKCNVVEWKAVSEDQKSSPDNKKIREARARMKLSREAFDHFVDEFETSKEVTAQEKPQVKKELSIDFQKRLAVVEALLRSKNYEFETSGDGWIILESSGDLKFINAIDDLEQYAITL
jgi:predicted  nucleic acid-binding Zn-ribbon protein